MAGTTTEQKGGYYDRRSGLVRNRMLAFVAMLSWFLTGCQGDRPSAVSADLPSARPTPEAPAEQMPIPFASEVGDSKGFEEIPDYKDQFGQPAKAYKITIQGVTSFTISNIGELVIYGADGKELHRQQPEKGRVRVADWRLLKEENLIVGRAHTGSPDDQPALTNVMKPDAPEPTPTSAPTPPQEQPTPEQTTLPASIDISAGTPAPRSREEALAQKALEIQVKNPFEIIPGVITFEGKQAQTYKVLVQSNGSLEIAGSDFVVVLDPNGNKLADWRVGQGSDTFVADMQGWPADSTIFTEPQALLAFSGVTPGHLR